MSKSILAIILTLCLVSLATATVYFDETFEGDWQSRWIASEAKGDENGKLELNEDGAVKTAEDARFYQYTVGFDEFSNADKDLVFQFEVRHKQGLDCGGGYLKLLPKGYDPKDFNGDTPYAIMFGPDICGSTKRTHVIFTYKGENHLIKNNVPCESDTLSHVYTLIVKPDQTFQVLIDNEEKRSGSLTSSEDYDILPPKMINDPEAKKPDDWVDEAKIADPEDKKPEDWDDIPAQIPDPEAKKPEDWDDDLDGEWTAPTIDNPDYKGEWKPRMIDNPDYKGPWVHPQIENPEYKVDENIYKFDDLAGIGLEIWQVKSGTSFDNILVTDDVVLAKQRAEDVLDKQQEQKEQQEKEAEEARKKAEEARKKAEAEKEAQEEDEQDDDSADAPEVHDEL